ncbi:hypothetical protein EV379_1235 [Microterricola gilva]|uniref:Uncharacterized protein n=1 Tax=Microterricola gilva TaxID=393267 RepID=A0A4Q8AKD0_9MICO|nr:hypothetical protein [Microterricola gilva]RZU64924.1 hypothetical protein EV379_1235 [Microterricola gilva]
MTGNLPDNPDGWAEKYPLSRYTELDIADEEGAWLLVSATEVGADV